MALMCSGRNGWQSRAATRLGAKLDWVLVWLAGVSIMKVLPQSPNAHALLPLHLPLQVQQQQQRIEAYYAARQQHKFSCLQI